MSTPKIAPRPRPQVMKLTERAGTVRWQIKLEPNAAKSLTYKYERYVPSN